jgi:hypothetical protein
MIKLDQLLQALTHSDEMIAEDLDFDEIVSDLKTKVDAYAFVVDKLEREEKYLKSQIMLLTKRKKSVAKNKAGLLEKIKVAMLYNESSKIPGFKCLLELKPTERAVTCLATEDIWVKYPEFITQVTTYSWDKVKLKSAIKSGLEIPQEIATIGTEWTPKFTTKKVL